MHWGHRVHGREGEVEVTRAEYNRAFGAPVPPEPEIPEHLKWPWRFWWRLHARRQTGEGVSPLQCHEIESLSRLSGEHITPEDFALIEAMDNAFLSAVAEERKAAMDRVREESKARPGGKGR